MSEMRAEGIAVSVEFEAMIWAEYFQAVTQGITLDRLEQLCAAEREGRAVVLTRKTGDEVCEHQNGNLCLAYMANGCIRECYGPVYEGHPCTDYRPVTRADAEPQALDGQGAGTGCNA
jgi:hypothetical protein